MKKIDKFFTPRARKIIAKKLGFSVRNDNFVVGDGHIASDKKILAMMLLVLTNGSFYSGAAMGAWTEGGSRAVPIMKEICGMFDTSNVSNGEMYDFVKQVWAVLLAKQSVKDSQYQVTRKKWNKLALI